MSSTQLHTFLKKYQRSKRRGLLRRRYLKAFEPIMLYRTTKTENPGTTHKMVADVMKKMR